VRCEGSKPKAQEAMSVPPRWTKWWETCGAPLAEVPSHEITNNQLLHLQDQIQEFFAAPYRPSPRGIESLPYWVLPLARTVWRFSAWRFAEGFDQLLASELAIERERSRSVVGPTLAYPATVAASRADAASNIFPPAIHRELDDRGLLAYLPDLVISRHMSPRVQQQAEDRAT
jgi:hypothetical protein